MPLTLLVLLGLLDVCALVLTVAVVYAVRDLRRRLSWLQRHAHHRGRPSQDR